MFPIFVGVLLQVFVNGSIGSPQMLDVAPGPEPPERSKVTCAGGRQKFVGGTQLEVGLVEKKEG